MSRIMRACSKNPFRGRSCHILYGIEAPISQSSPSGDDPIRTYIQCDAPTHFYCAVGSQYYISTSVPGASVAGSAQIPSTLGTDGSKKSVSLLDSKHCVGYLQRRCGSACFGGVLRWSSC